MKIYKYTSLNSAIAILKSEGVILNNPKSFNDPYDCSFVQDEKDKEEINKLLDNYAGYRILIELNSNNRINLSKINKNNLLIIQKEINALKKVLEVNPYFRGVPGFSLISTIIYNKKKDLGELVAQAKKNIQNVIKDLIEKEKDNALISCFSKKNNSILMRSHYANSHKGVCIEYDCPENKNFREVIYSRKKPKFKMLDVIEHVLALDILGKKETEEETFKYLSGCLDPFFTKSDEWKYENEVRCLYSRTRLEKEVEFSEGKYILKLGFPTAIYVGCKSSGDELSKLYELAQNRGIPVHFMKESEDSFDIVVDNDYVYDKNLRTKTDDDSIFKKLINEMDACLNAECYLAAFATSLIILTICSNIEYSEIKDVKERYIKWCNNKLSCSSKDCESLNDATVSGEVLWNIKEKLFTNFNIKLCDNYKDFVLNDFKVRIQKTNFDDEYCDASGKDNITFNITKFVSEIIYKAEKFYSKYENIIKNLDFFEIEDFDKELEIMKECAIITDRINKNNVGNK